MSDVSWATALCLSSVAGPMSSLAAGMAGVILTRLALAASTSINSSPHLALALLAQLLLVFGRHWPPPSLVPLLGAPVLLCVEELAAN